MRTRTSSGGARPANEELTNPDVFLKDLSCACVPCVETLAVTSGALVVSNAVCGRNWDVDDTAPWRRGHSCAGRLGAGAAGGHRVHRAHEGGMVRASSTGSSNASRPPKASLIPAAWPRGSCRPAGMRRSTRQWNVQFATSTPRETQPRRRSSAPLPMETNRFREMAREIAIRAMTDGDLRSVLVRLEQGIVYLLVFPGKHEDRRTLRRYPSLEKGWPAHAASDPRGRRCRQRTDGRLALFPRPGRPRRHAAGRIRGRRRVAGSPAEMAEPSATAH